MLNARFKSVLGVLCCMLGFPLWAALPVFTIEIRNHLFFPSELYIPADTKVKLKIINHDATPEEFESFELNREKVVFGNSKTQIFIGPLAAGRYPFFGEFNPNSAQGVVIVGAANAD